jgi:signal peptidase I
MSISSDNAASSPKEKISFKTWLYENLKVLLPLLVLVFAFRSVVFEPYRIPSGSMIPTLYIGDFILVNKFAYGWKVPFSEWCDKGGTLSWCEGPIYFGDQEVPERGDIVVFRYPVRRPGDEAINYIKRVVGLPGDKIDIRDRVLYLNDQPVERVELEDEAFIKETMEDLKIHYRTETLQIFEEKIPLREGSGTRDHLIMHDFASDFLSTWEAGPFVVPERSLFVMGDNREYSSDSRRWGIVPFEDVKGQAVMIWFSFVPPWSENPTDFHPERIGTILE